MLDIKEEELKKILPLDGPSTKEVKKYLKKYNDEYIVNRPIDYQAAGKRCKNYS